MTLKSLRSRAKLHLRGPKAVVQSHLGVLSRYTFWASETQFTSNYEVHVTCSGRVRSGSGPESTAKFQPMSPIADPPTSEATKTFGAASGAQAAVYAGAAEGPPRKIRRGIQAGYISLRENRNTHYSIIP